MQTDARNKALEKAREGEGPEGGVEQKKNNNNNMRHIETDAKPFSIIENNN